MDSLLELVNPQEIADMLVAFAPKALVAVLVALVFWLVYRITRRPIRSLLLRSGLEPNLVRLLVDNIYRMSVFVFGLVMAVSQLGVNVGAALAGIGVAGLAIGIAAQDSLANTIAGLTIFWDVPFRVRDFVTAAGQYGQVTEITLRSTRIRTPSNTYVVIPNKQIVDDVLINHTKNGETRINVPLGIAYKEDIPQARAVLLGAVAGLPNILKEPAPTVAVVELGNSSVNLEVRVWIEDAGDEASVTVTVLESCKIALDRADIQIPFPHLQLFVDSVERRVLEGISELPQMAAQKD